jgi:small subunit ribosomal protein S4
MARYTGAVCRLCRREQQKLFLKGNKCTTEKCVLVKRAFPPGQHGQTKTRGKLSNYGHQLREKQKVKRSYGVLERQFRRYFEIAAHTKGVTGKVLLQLLERRLDNVIFRLGVSPSRAGARQIVRHNFVYVNSVRVNIPSYFVNPGDSVEIRPKDKSKNKIKENLELTKDRTVPSWLEFDAASFKGRVIKLPDRKDIQQPIEEQLIVELYSK